MHHDNGYYEPGIQAEIIGECCMHETRDALELGWLRWLRVDMLDGKWNDKWSK